MSDSQGGPIRSPANGDPRRAFWSKLLPVLLTSLAWALILRKFQRGNVYELLGPFSLVVLAFTFGRRPRAIRTAFRPSRRALGLGLATGAVMTALVYPCYSVAQHWFPVLQAQVAELYRGARLGFAPSDLFWLWVVVLTEEVLWRGQCYRALTRRTSAPVAGVLSVLIYAAAQLGAGSWIVGLLAVTCGSVWMFLRWYTGGLLAPLLSHLIFTTTVIILHPVT